MHQAIYNFKVNILNLLVLYNIIVKITNIFIFNSALSFSGVDSVDMYLVSRVTVVMYVCMCLVM